MIDDLIINDFVSNFTEFFLGIVSHILRKNHRNPSNTPNFFQNSLEIDRVIWFDDNLEKCGLNFLSGKIIIFENSCMYL